MHVVKQVKNGKPTFEIMDPFDQAVIPKRKAMLKDERKGFK